MSNANQANHTGAVVRIVIWSVVLALILGCFCFLMAGGNMFGFNRKNVPIIQFGTDYWYDDTGYAAGGASVSERIRNLEINWPNGSVTVTVTNDGNADALNIRETASDGSTPEEEDALRWKLDNGKLPVRYARPRHFTVASSRGKALEIRILTAWLENIQALRVSAVSADVDVNLPERIGALSVETVSGNTRVNGDFEEVNIDTTTGVTTFSGSADLLNADSVSGRVDISMIRTAHAVEVDTTSGDVSVSGSAEELELDTVSGDMDVMLTDAVRSVQVDTTSGELRLTLPSDIPGFTAKLDSVSGDIEIDGFAVTGRRDTRLYGNGSARIEMDSVSGGMVIRSGPESGGRQ